MDEEFERDKFLIEEIKTTLTLASGTLIVSFGIIVSRAQLSYKLFLVISWISLVISILSGVKALNIGVLKYDRSIRGKKGELKDGEKELYERGHLLTIPEARTPKIQVWSFVVGLLCLLILTFLNRIIGPISKGLT